MFWSVLNKLLLLFRLLVV